MTEELEQQEVVNNIPSKSKSISITQTIEMSIDEEEIVEESPKERIQRMYHELAQDKWFDSFEDWYTDIKFKMATSWDLDKSDENLLKLLNTMADDMWYRDRNISFVPWSNLRSLTPKEILSK